jgi:hypothetical protein
MALEPAVTLAEAELPDAMLRPRLGACPVPERATDCGLSGALSVIVRVPVRLPVAVGVKETLTVQIEESVAPQSFVSVKSPLISMREI